MYKYPIALTQQFRFCGNPFRVDLYQGCSFGCAYCFSQNRPDNQRVPYDIADFSIVEKYFYKAFETDDAIMVCSKDRVQDVKKIVDELKAQDKKEYL